MSKEKRRQSNFEVLRIFSIMLIISFHYVWKGGFQFDGFGGVSFNQILVDLFDHFGELGVNCFMLISGYFLLDTKFRWRKVILLVCETEFYIILSRSFMIFVGWAELHTWEWRSYLFPILIQQYWFITVYILIYILSPYLQKLVSVLNKKELATLIWTQLFIWCLFPTFVLGILYHSNNTESMSYYSRFIWLIVVYLIGAYIRKYGFSLLKNLRRSIVCFIGTLLLIVLYILGTEFQFFPWQGTSAIYFWTPNSALQILLSISLFMIFLHLPIPYSKTINYIASCTLGIYLLHDGALNPYLWRQVFRNATHVNSHYFVIHIAIAVFIIMLVGIVIDSVRKVFEKGIVFLWESRFSIIRFKKNKE